MKLALIILMTLGGARKEALKRWPDGHWSLKVDQTKTKYVYELEVKVLQRQFQGIGWRCEFTRKTFTGANWQEVMDASATWKADCLVEGKIQ